MLRLIRIASGKVKASLFIYNEIRTHKNLQDKKENRIKKTALKYTQLVGLHSTVIKALCLLSMCQYSNAY